MDIDGVIQEMARQNREYERIIQEHQKRIDELTRRLDRVEFEYNKHSHTGNNILPS